MARRNLGNTKSTIIRETLENFIFEEKTFDLVTSRFVLHYIEDLNALFKKIYSTLNQDGHFIFSIQHPVTTSSFISKQSGERRENWIVDDYFKKRRKNGTVDRRTSGKISSDN
ncbi:class I SAM-dependent methyltransferase [Mangrovibacillus cuniculi]|uniref:class I SAM-dependent methyltransferase n=1 Tax=Mangrovibacillus cuniculi TaxID=2593652 RepID=UPI001EFA2024|nr:methyltransferase domain-containing protein [Mangrovibacillus cuniculi]